MSQSYYPSDSHAPTVEITCPSCGTVSYFDQVRRNAQEFCRRCDFPLFWVRSGDQPAGEGGDDEFGLRRLPGAGGRQVVASIGCPQCNEPNLHSATLCIRCGADLHPPAMPPPAPVIAAPAPPPPPPEPEPEVGPIWPYLVAMIGIPVAIALVFVGIIG
ncbi:MAG: hypothetical protein U5K29_03255 [Acidimicrobiales bacterium]|nr:hypothetical protein [Acidimicrobiales bacterium]